MTIAQRDVRSIKAETVPALLASVARVSLGGLPIAQLARAGTAVVAVVVAGVVVAGVVVGGRAVVA